MAKNYIKMGKLFCEVWEKFGRITYSEFFSKSSEFEYNYR